MTNNRTCTFPACDKAHEAHGLCTGHLMQRKRGSRLKPLRKREVMPVINGHKVCTKCRVFKPLDDYYMQNGKHKAWCKDCMKANVLANQARRATEERLAAASN